MAQTAEVDEGQGALIASFYVGNMLFGIDALRVEEAIKVIDITAVPHAPEHVMGVINLRGKIVTIVNLARKIGLPDSPIGENSRFIIMSWDDEYIGLLADSVADVVPIDPERMQAAPSNVKGMQGKFFAGVHQSDAGLLIILKEDVILAD